MREQQPMAKNAEHSQHGHDYCQNDLRRRRTRAEQGHCYSLVEVHRCGQIGSCWAILRFLEVDKPQASDEQEIAGEHRDGFHVVCIIVLVEFEREAVPEANPSTGWNQPG